MSQEKQIIQDIFLNSLRKTKVPVTIYLTNGVKLQGVVSSFDNFCIVLKRSGQAQLIYKHSVATVVPSAPMSYSDQDSHDQHEAIASNL